MIERFFTARSIEYRSQKRCCSLLSITQNNHFLTPMLTRPNQNYTCPQPGECQPPFTLPSEDWCISLTAAEAIADLWPGKKIKLHSLEDLSMYQDVLSFWFKEIEPRQWWAKDDKFDQLIRERLSNVHSESVPSSPLPLRLS